MTFEEFKEAIINTPLHSGRSIAGLENAKDYLEKLFNEVKKFNEKSRNRSF